ncbi:uncharacterized protein LY79DRAFT_413164 [Colletotrichum navitas]|uniref:Uncharacterized protein n=1 Tax=Colletotrichum navitas TaxID=681940 RepID=A0AAD8PP37_9PEZI|nr:uncharacterized protein LY79DRAFT_413164 [Colletotrichum navitas]KAK1573378.1 hypothetical protein LY79DRAFT_413164 [Colletotrichum navitas]
MCIQVEAVTVHLPRCSQATSCLGWHRESDWNLSEHTYTGIPSRYMPSALRLQLPSSRPQVGVHPRTVSDAGRDCQLVPEAWSSITPSPIPTRAALRETMRRRLSRLTSDDSLSDLQEARSFSSMGPTVGLLASFMPHCSFLHAFEHIIVSEKTFSTSSLSWRMLPRFLCCHVFHAVTNTCHWHQSRSLCLAGY